LRAFRRDGTVIPLARRGHGPGELSEVSTATALAVVGDTVAIQTGTSLAFIDRNGRLVREQLVGRTSPRFSKPGTFNSVFVGARFGLVGGTPEGPATARKQAFYRISDEDSTGPRIIALDLHVAVPPFRAMDALNVQPVGTFTKALFTETGIIVVDGQTPGITVYDYQGRVVQRVRVPLAARATTSHDIDDCRRFVNLNLDRLVRRAQAVGHYLSSKPVAEVVTNFRTRLAAGPQLPDTLPAIADALVDADENLWLRPWVAPWVEQVEADWHVVRRDGQMLGVVRIPDDLRVVQIGSDFVLGTRLDGDGLPVVEVYGLKKQ
jgi:hypothetical protein